MFEFDRVLLKMFSTDKPINNGMELLVHDVILIRNTIPVVMGLNHICVKLFSGYKFTDNSKLTEK